MLKKVILGILLLMVVAVTGFVIVVAMQPEDFTITRSAAMAAPPDKIFERVNDFHKWESWSPWAKLDPNMKTTFSGAQSGVGASYSWVGNDQVGEGKMTITESHAPDHVKIDLAFIKPFTANNVTQFVMKPEGDKTNVGWIMTGKNNFIAKAFNLLMDMDKLVGADFEKGLAQMKTVVESQQ